MIKKEKTTKEVEEISDIICNRCGKSCMSGKNDGIDDGYGLIETTVCGGYWSTYLYDDVRYTFSLCEECLRELFDNFIIPPKTQGGGLVCPEGEREYETKEIRESNKIEWKKEIKGI